MEKNNYGLVVCDDGVARPPWAKDDSLLSSYYDTEWGVEVRDEQPMFERLCLEGFQVGLSWRLILQKRQALRDAFAGFDPDAVAQMDSIGHLCNRADLIRNRRKLQAVLTNAKATVALREEGTHLGEVIWNYQPDQNPDLSALDQPPTQSPESVQLAQDLKRRGFSFVGPVNMYALMQSTGIVTTHF